MLGSPSWIRGEFIEGEIAAFPHPEPRTPSLIRPPGCPPQKITSHQLSPALIHRKPFPSLPYPAPNKDTQRDGEGEERKRSHKKPAPSGIYLGSPGVHPAAPHPPPSAKFIVSLRGIPGKSPQKYLRRATCCWAGAKGCPSLGGIGQGTRRSLTLCAHLRQGFWEGMAPLPQRGIWGSWFVFV